MNAHNSKKQAWIDIGYEIFAYQGVNGLLIEAIAKSLGKNKSSFYHYFGSTDLFIADLLEWHMVRAVELSVLAQNCHSMKPDVLSLLVDRKVDLFFHRQLRIHQSEADFKSCYAGAFKKVEAGILNKWADSLGLKEQTLFASTLLHLLIDSFMLSLTESTFSYEWMDQYLEDVRMFVRQTNIAMKRNH